MSEKPWLSITVPWWLFWLIPKRLYTDLDNRSALTGKSSKEIGKLGRYSMTASMGRTDHGRDGND